MRDTYVRSSRRAQLLDLAIDLLAEAGLAGTSFARLAERAGVSRPLVHYHFTGRQDLLDAVVDRIYALGAEEVTTEVRRAGSPAASLATFVRSSIAFYARRPTQLRALTAIYTPGTEDGVDRESRPEHRAEMEGLRVLLRAGQADGTMRGFDVDLMAVTIRAVLDLAVALVVAGADPTDLGDELARTVLAMTRGEETT